MVSLPDRLLMSYEEYLAWESTQEMRHEYFNGEVIAMAGGTRNHNRVSFNTKSQKKRLQIARQEWKPKRQWRQ